MATHDKTVRLSIVNNDCVFSRIIKIVDSLIEKSIFPTTLTVNRQTYNKLCTHTESRLNSLHGMNIILSNDRQIFVE